MKTYISYQYLAHAVITAIIKKKVFLLSFNYDFFCIMLLQQFLFPQPNWEPFYKGHLKKSSGPTPGLNVIFQWHLSEKVHEINLYGFCFIELADKQHWHIFPSLSSHLGGGIMYVHHYYCDVAANDKMISVALHVRCRWLLFWLFH